MTVTTSSTNSLKEILTTGRYFRRKFGESVYKIPVSITGFTCPNIDGRVSKGGCSFCENHSFSPNLGVAEIPKKFRLSWDSCENPFLQQQLEQMDFQVQKTRNKLKNKFKAHKFIVYFQSFTNTYAPLETLKVLYEKALSYEGVVGISIGTRSDAINDEILDYLEELAKKYEVWIEYGIQTKYDETLKRINRGHDFTSIVEAIKKTKERGILVCGHLIFGLPGETQEMMIESVKTSIDLGIDSIKIHPLYITKKTVLANEFLNGKFEPIGEEDYIQTLIESLRIIPSNVMVQRVTAGIDSESLLAPSWCKDLQRQKKKIYLALKEAGFDY